MLLQVLVCLQHFLQLAYCLFEFVNFLFLFLDSLGFIIVIKLKRVLIRFKLLELLPLLLTSISKLLRLSGLLINQLIVPIVELIIRFYLIS